MAGETLDFDTRFETPPGAVATLSPLTRRVVAPNGGAFTFTGTCSYVVGRGKVAIVDPGPEIPAHVEALLGAIRGEKLVAILPTHTHRDHAPAARLLSERTGAPILGCTPHRASGRDAVGVALDDAHDADYAPDRALRDGETVKLGDATLVALETPGHTANHLCYTLEEERTVFTGDHVMAWSTTIVAPPDGSMRAYMASLEKLRARDDALYWPAHGGPVEDPQSYLRALAHHRRQREAAILQRLEAGDATIAEMVAKIYGGVDKRLHPAAACMALAHLLDLAERGVVRAEGTPGLFARWRRA